MQPIPAQPTPYQDLNAVLQELLAGVRQVLGGNLVGAYLQGSFARGDFDEHSDVDFLVVVEHELTAEHEAALQALHGRIYDLSSPWAQHLEGSYITAADLRRYNPTNAPLLYIDNTSRVLERSAHDNNLVMRWTLREHGVVLAGPAPRDLVDPVAPGELRQEVAADMRDWGAKILAEPQRLNNRWYQPFAVLSYCRMLYSLETGTVASKLAGARWAQAALDPQWSGLIGRAWDERPNPSLKARQPADPADFHRTLDFIRYAISIID